MSLLAFSEFTMNRSTLKHLSFLSENLPHFFKAAFFSLALTLPLCNYAYAQSEQAEASNFWRGFSLGGYSSAGITAYSNGDAEAALNEVSLFLSWEGNSRFSFFSELELERPLSWREGKRVSDTGSYLDLERFYFDYNLSDTVNIRAGRFLTPAGRWNELHAAPLVWTTTRPLVTSRLFPNATNGAMLYGAVPINEDAAIEYKVFAEAIKDQHQDGVEILFKDVRGARVAFAGTANVGVQLLEFKERSVGNPNFRMIGLDFVKQYQGWEFSGEGFQRFYTDGRDGGSGAYLQAVAPIVQQWYGLARLETYEHPNEGSTQRWLLGAALRVTPHRILKLEIVGGDEARVDAPKGFLASFAVLF